MYRLQNPAHTKNRRLLMPIMSGAVGAVLTHGALSWIRYTTSDDAMTTRIGDSGTVITQRVAELSGQRRAAEGIRSVAMGSANDLIATVVAGGIGAVGSGYGIYRWRNPKGQRKKKWVLALVGGIVGGHIVGGLTFAFLASRRAAAFASMLGDDSGPHLPATLDDGPLSFSSVSAALTSTGVLVGVLGGAKYLYDSYKPRRRKR